MSDALPNRSPLNALDIGTVLGRWFLGGLFIYMGLVKALDPVGFLKLVRQYDMVNQSLVLNSIAAALPWFEVFCGLLLITGVAVRGVAVMLIAMLIPFTLLVLKRALAIASAEQLALCAVKFDCGCGTGEVLICRKLAENTGLTLLAIWLLFGRGRHWAARYSLFGFRRQPATVNPVEVPAPVSER